MTVGEAVVRLTAMAEESEHDAATLCHPRGAELDARAIRVVLDALTKAGEDQKQPEPNWLAGYTAGLKEYHETVAYWPPEFLSSPEHVETMIERVLHVAVDAAFAEARP